jgi:hypothetical protein
VITLSQLRDQQVAAGLVAPRDDDDGVLVVQTSFIHPEQKSPVDLSRPATSVDVTQVSPTSSSPVVSSSVPVADKGFLRILPPEMNSIREAGEEWRAQNWAGPSPWCRVEGQPDHPDFEANLKAFE